MQQAYWKFPPDVAPALWRKCNKSKNGKGLLRPTTLVQAEKTCTFFCTGTQCVITGWGRTRQRGSTSPVLREAKVPIISDEDCKQNYRPELITSNMICAGFSGGGIDACQGDSGGKKCRKFFICRIKLLNRMSVITNKSLPKTSPFKVAKMKLLSLSSKQTND